MKLKLHSEVWKKLPWKKFRRELFRLQHRVWKAIRVGDTAQAKNLQKLILRNRGARLLAIRQVTQLNAGKKTAGIDGQASLSFAKRFALEEILKRNVFNWVHQGLREIPIPKRDGTNRILKVPTLNDRAWQCLVKYALEPAHEATFAETSYGFRPGRSAHDAQKHIWLNLRANCRGFEKQVLELDIEKCFDRIGHNHLIRQIIAPMSVKHGLWKCLKSGVNPSFPDQGTPTGGVISPLLANIALNGVENIGSWWERRNGKTIQTCIRYADDMVFLLHPEQNAQEILQDVEEFLSDRGLNIKASKTHLVAATDGFDFLGWTFKVLPDKRLKTYPTKESFRDFKKKCKAIINNSNYGADVKAQKLAPTVRGYLNYHRYADCSKIKASIWFINHRAYKVFLKQKTINRYRGLELIKQAFPKVSYAQGRYVKVKGNKTPFDGDLPYWSQRNSRLYDGQTSKALKRQNHTCGMCGMMFTDEERVHLHHVDGNHGNWKTSNILAVHQSCHQTYHMSKAESALIIGSCMR